ncbi:unnamed protein product, partial [Ectocarpus sp. 12 AP-2014]
SVRQSIGLRKVELVRGPGGDGETMYFRVNGVDVFARGSNFVPPDAWGQR